MTKEITPLYLVWIPAVYFIVQMVLEFSMQQNFLNWYVSENGPIEILQNLIIFSAFGVAIFSLISKAIKPVWLKAWFGLAALCCLYVTGEEVSWGQHIWNWSTPENWSEINDQQETNLHNTSSWLDQKPRLVLLVGITFGALIYPILKKMKMIKLPEKIDFIFPAKNLGFIALLILFSKISEKTLEAFDISLFARFSEVEELYMFYFVLIYLIALYIKTKKSKLS